VAGALTYFSDYDELYWNVTGNDWPVSIGEAAVEVELPAKLSQKETKVACYTGFYASSQSLCQSSFFILDNGRPKIVTKSDLSLGPKEGLTVVVGFPKNVVAVLEPKEYKCGFSGGGGGGGGGGSW